MQFVFFKYLDNVIVNSTICNYPLEPGVLIVVQTSHQAPNPVGDEFVL